MKISKSNIKNNSGFTIVELIVVVLGLAALSSISIPNVIKYVKTNKLEEVKALMNSYAADCLINYRNADNKDQFLNDYKPEQLFNEKLESLNYQIDGDKKTCKHVAIKPLNENEEDLFAIDFQMFKRGRDIKLVKSADPPSSLDKTYINLCKGWAGENCGISEEQKARIARYRELEAAEVSCDSNYYTWIEAKSSGEYTAWDSDKEACSRAVWAFEGKIVSGPDAVEQLRKDKYGEECLIWRKNKRDSLFTDEGAQTLSPYCGGINYWFHSGTDFTTKAAWTAYDNKLKQTACEKNRTDALNGGENGKYTIGPEGGPSPCGEVVWLCNGDAYGTKSDYETSSCSSKVIDEEKGDEPDPDDPCENSLLITFCSFMDDPGLCKQVENCPSK